MKEIELIQTALMLSPPWNVVECQLDINQNHLDIHLDFTRGSRFSCPDCGQAECAVHDTVPKSWRHLNFFQHDTYMHARVPRIKCNNCGVRVVTVPWARNDSGFTLLFEAYIMLLAPSMPVKKIGELVTEHDTRLWRLIQHHVDKAREEADYSNVKKVGVDETSSKRGQNYVSIFVDLEKSKTIFATEGKDSTTVERFKVDLSEHGGDPDAIKNVSCDMSPAFIKGVVENLPNAEITFDKFHILKTLNDAVDKVRSQEQKGQPELKKTRYIFLKNPKNLTSKQADRLEDLKLKDLNLKTMRAYHLRLNFQELWLQPSDQAEHFLKKWYYWATHSRIEPMKEAAYTIKRHWDGVLNWFKSGINNGILEGFNSLVQAAKARARGYRTNEYLITMIYLITGKLKLDLPVY
jgi:transposase